MPLGTLPPSGTRDIDSMPQAMPALIASAAIMACHEMGGLLGRGALGVDHGRRGVVGQPGMHPGAADHVVGLLAGLGDAAADDLVDQLGVDAGALEHLDLCGAEQHGGVYAGQPALALAEGGADGFDDDWVTHGTKLEHVLIPDKVKRASTRKKSGVPFRTNRWYVTMRN